MRINLETERLILRSLTPEDYQAAFLWCGDPDVARYMVYPVYTKAEDVRTWLESLNPDDPDDFDAGIVLKSTGERPSPVTMKQPASGRSTIPSQILITVSFYKMLTNSAGRAAGPARNFLSRAHGCCRPAG